MNRLVMTKKQNDIASYSVYIHINKGNGKKYIGITKQKPERRWQKGKGYNKTYFGNAIQKYGWDNFEHNIIKNGLTKEEACKLEIELIRTYKTNQKEYGYNISEGGQTADYIRNIKGIKHPNHKRVKMIDAKTGEVLKVFDTQTSASEIMGFSRKDITKACRGELNTYKGYIWEYADIEFEKPKPIGYGNYKHTKIQKPIIMIDDKGEHYFESIKTAAEVLNINKSNISRYLTGIRTDKKRRWFYAS